MRSLAQEGVRQGDVTAFCFDRGISQILGILSVLEAGAAFVPLDPDDPTLRKELIVEECGAKVLLTTSDHSRVFQKREPGLALTTFEVKGLSPSSLAYIMSVSSLKIGDHSC